jgi:hypothetical protein
MMHTKNFLQLHLAHMPLDVCLLCVCCVQACIPSHTIMLLCADDDDDDGQNDDGDDGDDNEDDDGKIKRK